MSTLSCASVARDTGLDPLGTAGRNDGFLLVDWPLPWPSDLSDVAALEPVRQALAGTGIRLQGVVPAPGDRRRVVLYHRRHEPDPGLGFAGYARAERTVAPAEVVAAAVELVRAGPDALARSVATPAAGSLAGSADTPAAPVTGDVLVCTHGRRDACCGSRGTTLVLQLMGEPALAAAGYRVGRTTHTGGHRFAPTAILLPEGTMWAFLDADLTRRIVERSGDVTDVLGEYRGSTGIGGPEAQAVERAAFAEIGWDWLSWRRWSEPVGDGVVRVTGVAPGGTRATWEAVVDDRPRPVPDCGKPLDQARKQQHEPVVVSIVRST